MALKIFKVPNDTLALLGVNKTLNITRAAILALKSRAFNIPDSEFEESVGQFAINIYRVFRITCLG